MVGFGIQDMCLWLAVICHSTSKRQTVLEPDRTKSYKCLERPSGCVIVFAASVGFKRLGAGNKRCRISSFLRFFLASLSSHNARKETNMNLLYDW